MRSPHKQTAEGGIPGGCKDVRADETASFVAQPFDQRQPKPLIDRHGNRYRETVLRNWSPTMLRIMGIRRARP